MPRRTLALLLSLVASLQLGFEWEGRVGRLRRALSSSEPAERIEAVRALARHPSAAAREPLLRALDDRDPDVRVEAVRALGEAGVADAVPRLVELLSDSEVALRAAAARALGAIGARDAVPSLVRALGDARAEVRRAAVEGLAAIGDDAALVPLVARLDDADADVRVGAVRALVGSGDARAIVPLVARARDDTPEVRAAVATALGDLGDPRGIPPLVQALDDPTLEVRLAAIAALARVGDEDAAQALALRTTSTEDRIARAATGALGRLPGERALSTLIETLARPALAPIAAEALRQRAARGDSEVVPALAEALDAATARSRADALARTLLALTPEVSIAAAAPALVRALEDGRGDPALVVVALGATGSPDALLPVLERLRAATPDARAAAIEALARWTALRGPDGRAADPLLEALRAGGPPAERATLARLLGELGAPRALPELRALVEETAPAAQGSDTAQRDVLLAAIDALGALGLPEATPSLLPLLDARDGRARHAAARALGRTAPADVIAALAERALAPAPADRHALLLAVGAGTRRLAHDGALRARVGAALLELVDAPDLQLAAAALAAVAELADPALAPRLVARLEVAAPGRRPTLVAALGALDHDDARAALVRAAAGDDDAAVVALSRLGEHGTRESAEWLLEHAATLRWPSSAAASFALARLARRGLLDAGDAPVLCGLSRSRDPWTRANLAIALGALGTGACGDRGEADPLAWLEPRNASVVRAAAARWARAAIAHGVLDPTRTEEALARCASEPVPSAARDACRAPAPSTSEPSTSEPSTSEPSTAVPAGARLPLAPRASSADRVDVVAWSADGSRVLDRTLVALRLADGSTMITRTDENGRIQLDDAPPGAVSLEHPSSLPLEP